MPDERSNNARTSPLVMWVNLRHRFLRGMYLKFGSRKGSDSLDYLPFSCVVYALDAKGSAPQWVLALRSDVGGSSRAPAEFGFSAGQPDVHLVPRARVILVDYAIAAEFMGVFQTRNPKAQVVVVGNAGARNLSLAKECTHRARAVAPPKKGGGSAWLQQFS